MSGFIAASIISRRIRGRRQRIAGAAAAAAAPPQVGGSLSNTTIQEISRNINTERNVTIQLSNYSHKYILTSPRVFTSSGYCHIPPHPTIQRKMIEACSFTETAGTGGGAVGLLTYEIYKHDDKRWVGELVIMFSVPNDYKLSQNWFALGIFQNSVSCDEHLFSSIYYNTGPFTKAPGSGSEISFTGNCTYVKGTMSPASRSIMYVELWDL